MLTRRELLRSTALVPVGLLLAKCSMPATQIAATAAAAIEAVGTEAANIMPELEKAGLSGADATTAQTVISEMESVANTVSATSTQAQGQAALTQIEDYVNALAPLVTPFLPMIPGGGTIGIIIAAIPAIEPLIDFGVSMLSAQAQALAAPPAATAPVPGMAPVSPAQAAMLELIRRASGH